MGNYIPPASAGITIVASEETWIEGKAIQQLETTARMEGMHQVVGMPDLHPGRGYPIGAAFFSVGRFYPALVGNDIGCGMTLWHTGIASGKASLDKLDKQLGSIDEPLDDSWCKTIETLNLPPTGHERTLGTIGGGNHFAELQRLDEIYDEAAVQAVGLDRKHLCLLVHSGSRGLGEAILREHVEQFGHHGLAEGTQDAERYFVRHEVALKYAEANRHLIALRMLDRWHAAGKRLIDIHHNLVMPATMAGRHGWLHRKGATPSDQGIVVIPGSRGDYSYLVEPYIDENTLRTLAHGAGRKWVRTDCKDRISMRYTVQQLGRTALGSRVICEDKQLIFEEAPEAYKAIDSVIKPLLDAGLIRLLARLKPMLTYKTRGRCC